MSAATLLTFAQFEALPDKPGRQELLHGRVIEMPPPFGCGDRRVFRTALLAKSRSGNRRTRFGLCLGFYNSI